jgi:hypothetical protein
MIDLRGSKDVLYVYLKTNANSKEGSKGYIGGSRLNTLDDTPVHPALFSGAF